MQYPRERFRPSRDRRGRGGPRVGIIAIITVGVLAAATAVFVARGARGLSFAELDAVNLAQAAFEAGDFEETVSIADRILEEDTLNASALVLKGFAHYHAGVNSIAVDERTQHLDAAIVALRRALLLGSVPIEERVYHVLGKAYYHKGPYFVDSSITYLEESVAAGYDQSETYEYLGLAYSDFGDYGQSADNYLLALRSRPVEERDVIYVFLAESYRELGELDEAAYYLRLAVNTSQDNFLTLQAQFALAEVLTELGNTDQAVLQYEAILEENPQSAEALIRLGDIYAETGNPERARFYWRRVVTEVDPENPEAHARLERRQ